ncbi:hypothetical protein FNB15_05540 [Ferrovibrio terrae]|uniref:DUF1868 domain-containing protein n=1 Tax=Ferrovibrio terrae TaxID=2594003 RepID=A0A516GZ55_9PROT|nr:hypothetical protein [Ferrovibrio terrae]QDO96775.1 hypothetical protein FNB15_05540 [Ferrovibrio terrae]
MNGFIRDQYWGQSLISYTVMQMLEPATREACLDVLRRVSAMAGSADYLLIAPAETFHLSLYAIAPVRSDFDKDAWWQIHGEQALAVFRRWCAAQPATLLRFRELRVTQTAVVAVAEPQEVVWSLRRVLRAEVPQPPGGTPNYDMIHMTLARYAQPEKLPADFAARVMTLPLDLKVRLFEPTLMRETAYPLLGGKPVETHALRAPEPIMQENVT